MKVILLKVILLLVLSLVSAFELIDYEIFDLHDALIKTTGNNDTTFYSVLNLTSTATKQDINRAYRTLSRDMHPDKTDSQSDKKLYTLLTSISTILKDPVSRTIYDAHLQKGIPVWRGTGYYYAKFKPGLGFVSVFLLLVASFVQYVSAWLIWWRNSRQLAEQENIYDGLTSTQLKKVLKKNGIESDLKNPSGSQVAELIKSASSESLNIDVGGVQKPSIFGVLIFTLPIAIVKLPFTLMSRKKKEKEEEIVEEVVEVVKSERKGKGGKRRINGKQAKSITELKEQMSK